MIVQAVGVMSTLIVLMQLAIAGAMPLPAFAATSTAVVLGFILNLLNYQELLRPSIWRLWEEAVTIGGVTVLPQVCVFCAVEYSLISLSYRKSSEQGSHMLYSQSKLIVSGSIPEYYLASLPFFLNKGFRWVQVMWSTFEPFLPHSMLPSIVCGTAILSLVILVCSIFIQFLTFLVE